MLTIREYLQSQRRTITKAQWVGLAVLVALHSEPHDVRINCAAAAAGAVIAAGFVMVLRRLRCPICCQSLSKSCLDILYGEGLASCPHCGAEYSQPMPQTPFR